jgi:hypothetical protein
MRDFEDSTLWRVSAFERVMHQTGNSGFNRLDGPSLLPSTLLADLRRLDDDPTGGSDVLEIVAACVRHRHPALLCLQHEELVWPVTVFPNEMLYHSPRDMALATPMGLANLNVITTEPAGVKPPDDVAYERVGQAEHYRPLTPLLWSLALNGPRKLLLAEISGPAAYRALHSPTGERPPALGALGSAIDRLRRESVSLRDIAKWPGLSVERASRLLNALYLTSSLMVTRSHAAARAELDLARSLALGLHKPYR